jgi:hypothetical protein
LSLALSVPAGARLERDGLLLPGGVRYSGLEATDAGGRTLRGWFELSGRRAVIRVDDKGARYPVRIDPFVQRAELTASDGGAGDGLGYSVAVSGDTVVAGADLHQVGSNSQQGAVYVFTMAHGGWADGMQTAELTASDGAFNDELGISVAISGDTIVAGAPLHRGASGVQQGAEYVFTMSAAGWATGTQTAELSASDGGSGDRLGESVAISGDTAVAGAPSHQAAYVFAKPSGGWRDGTETAELTPSDGASIKSFDMFGAAVAESGDTIVVGSPGHAPGRTTGGVRQGAVYVFAKPVGAWATGTQTAELTESDPASGDLLGASVAMAGDTIIAGAPRLTSTATRGGSAYVFAKPAGGWADATQTAELTPTDNRLNDNFGFSVAISGGMAVVGAIQQPPVAGGAQGAAYVFAMPAAGWADATEDAKLTASDAASGDWLGFSVAVSAYTIVTGAPYHAVASKREQGALYVFRPAPGVTITTPVDGGAFAQGQVVRAAFACSPDAAASVASCTAPVDNGEPLDTSTLGSHTFTVTAVDSLGSTTSRTVDYTVVGPPAVTITTPADGGAIGQGQVVRAAFSCTAQAGANITGCTAPAVNGQPVDTSTLGSHTFTVTAVDSLGSTTSRSVSYTVVGPPTLAAFSQSANTWSTHKTNATQRKAGVTYSFMVDQDVTVRFMFAQHRTGHRVKGKCVAATRQNRSRPECTNAVDLGALSFRAHAGRNTVRFGGRLTSGVLKPGAYTVQITATNTFGERSASRELRFTITP